MYQVLLNYLYEAYRETTFFLPISVDSFDNSIQIPNRRVSYMCEIRSKNKVGADTCIQKMFKKMA